MKSFSRPDWCSSTMPSSASAFRYLEAVWRGDDVLDLGARPCLEEGQGVDQHRLIRDQLGGLLQLGQGGARSDTPFENRLRLEIDCRRERRQVIEGVIR